MTLLEAALDYAARGLHVFPVHGITNAGACDCAKSDCGSPGKHPLTSDGFKSATTDADQIKNWWARWPSANVGIRTGIESGIIVLDVDGADGESFLKGKHMPPTPMTKTGKGRHVFFKHPGGIVNNAVRIAPAIDIRGDSGYVVVAPSKHASGAVYSWFETLSFEDTLLADAPAWLLDLMRSKPKTARPADVREDAEADEAIPEGERNDRLYRMACSLRSKSLGEGAILAALSAENTRLCRPPLSETEIKKIAERAAKHKRGKIGDTEQGPTCAQRLVEIGLKSQLFYDERGDAYARVEEPGKVKILRVHSSTFRRWLSGSYYKAGGGVANNEALRSAVEVLEHRAVHDGNRLDLHNRFSRKDGAVWLDLCDERGRAVRITAEGWDVVDAPPILFRRFAHQAALPEPVKGGDLRDFLPRINIARPEDGILILAWLVTAPLVDIPRPILCFHGPQGSAKSTAARMLRALLDPSAVEATSLRRDAAELAQVLDHHAVPLFDNLSGITHEQADLLCCAVTGGGFQKRVLYSDDDDTLRAFKRAVLMTAITVPTVAPDLLDRTMLVELQRVPPDQRREEAELWSAFNAERPRLLGGLLDALSAALKAHPTLKIKQLPRMADFGRWGAATAEALGFGADAFLNAYLGNVKAQLDEIIESDPIAAAVCDLAKADGPWTGRATELLKVLTDRRGAGAPGDGWPKTPGKLSGRLRRLQTTLTDAGIGISWGKDEAGYRGRAITVRTLAASSENLSSLASLSSSLDGDTLAKGATIKTFAVAVVADAVAELPLKNKDSDACDASDARSQPLAADDLTDLFGAVDPGAIQ